MNHALAVGAAGMAAQQAELDAIAGNLANADTPGYRAGRADFATLVDARGRASVAEIGSQRLFSQGKLDATGRELDVAIDGAGLFQVTTREGRTAYTRAGDFTLDTGARLRLPNGAALDGVRVHGVVTAFEVAANGVTRATTARGPARAFAGRIRLWNVPNPGALDLGADGLLYATRASGKPYAGTAGTGGFGAIKQRFLERSNVNIVAAMMAVLAAQRAYEANAKTVQAADEMLRLANNLERG